MAYDLSSILPSAALGGLAAWLGQAAIAWIKSRGDQASSAKSTEARMEEHRDNLTFELLQEARTHLSMVKTEVVELRREVKVLRELEKHFFYFEQSLDHLETILSAPTPEERHTAERNARAFLTRMRRLNEARGTLRNEIQRAASEVSVMGDTLGVDVDQLPPTAPL